jgi:hypothetical protein
MAAMLGFVASGSYRGIKDTATPLKAAILAAGTNLVLTPLLIIGERSCAHWLLVHLACIDMTQLAAGASRIPSMRTHL